MGNDGENEKENNGEENNESPDDDLMDFDKVSFNLFNKSRKLLKYVDPEVAETMNIFEIFRPCLGTWVEYAAKEAQKQIKNAMKITRVTLNIKNHKPTTSYQKDHRG